MLRTVRDFIGELAEYFPPRRTPEQTVIFLEKITKRLEEYIGNQIYKYDYDKLLDVFVETYKPKILDFPLYADILERLKFAKISSSFNYDENSASLWVLFKNNVWLEFVLPKGMPPSTAIDLGKKNYRGSIDWVYCPADCGFNREKGELIKYEQVY